MASQANNNFKGSSVALITAYGWVAISTPVIMTAKFLAQKGYIVDLFIVQDVLCANLGINIPFFSEKNIHVHIYREQNPETIKYVSFKGVNIPSTDLSFANYYIQPPRKYDFIVGFDPDGLVRAGVLSDYWGVPYIYHSLELYDESTEVKARERFFSQKALLTIIQDERRADILSKLNGIDRNRIFIVYNNSIGDALPGKKSFFHNKFSIPSNKLIVLATGTLLPIHGIDKIISSVEKWQDNFVLILHGWIPDQHFENFVRSSITLNQEKIFLSTEIVKAEDKFDIFQSANIGLVFFQPEHINMTFAAGSSGKLFDFMRTGVPVIGNDIPGMRELVEDNNCGLVVKDAAEISNALSNILNRYDYYQKNAISSFYKFNFKDSYEKVLDQLFPNKIRGLHNNISIVHINTHDIAGGAAKVAWRLAEAQRNAGHNARMLVGNKMSDSEYSSSFPVEVDPFVHFQCQQQGQLFYEFQGSHKLIKHPVVQSTDILHLHNLHGGYFNPFSISALSHLKPIVWTLHDMQSFTGHCAHSFDCEKWDSGCGNCPYPQTEPALSIDTSSQLWKDKKLIYEHSYLYIVTPSQWLKNKVEKSILRYHPVELIYNGIDINIFSPKDKKEARDKFNIPQNAFIIGAVGHGGTLLNQWKGGRYTQSALDILLTRIPNNIFVNIGADEKSDNPHIINIPHIKHESEIAHAYSALDVFLYTPMADNCPLVILEALACGVPIVTFNTGGVPELVRHGEDGLVTESKDVSQIIKFTEKLYSHPKLRYKYSQNSRKRAVSMFDHYKIAAQYEKLYEQYLEANKTKPKQVRLFSSASLSQLIITPAFLEAENAKAQMRIPKKLSDKIDVSIIIATKNRAQLLDEMLTSLKMAAEGVRYEVIAVEGTSTDNTLEVLHKHGVEQIYDETEYLGEGKHSWPQLYNFGFSKAEGKWAMFASDDIIFQEGCLSKAIEILKSQNSDVAGGIFFYKNVIAEPGWNDYGIDFTYGQKLLMNYGLLRLEGFNQVGRLDERYKFYCADGDLCLKLYEHGKEFIPLPGCFVIHNNVSDAQKQMNMQVAQKDIDRYIARWSHFVSSALPNPRRLMWKDFEENRKTVKEMQPATKGEEAGTETLSVLDQIRRCGCWKEGQPLRLHLGCGEQQFPGYINIDYPPSEHNVMKVKADIHADITRLEFPPGSVDEIRLHHVFEHFNRVTALVLLIRWHKWLKIGGKLWIETPDIMGSAKTLLSNVSWHIKTGVIRHLTGDQADTWAYHIDQWFPERFEHTLRKFGFDPVETQSTSWQQEPYLSNVHAIAKKAHELSTEALLRASEELLWESTVSPNEKPTYEVWCRQLREIVLRGTQSETFKAPQMETILQTTNTLKQTPSVTQKADEETTLLENLRNNFRDVAVLIRLAELELMRSNQKKARNYLIAANALDPENEKVKYFWEKLKY